MDFLKYQKSTKMKSCHTEFKYLISEHKTFKSTITVMGMIK